AHPHRDARCQRGSVVRTRLAVRRLQDERYRAPERPGGPRAVSRDQDHRPTGSMNLVWQPTLLDAASGPDVDASFSGLVRVELDETAWVDHAPGWVTGSDELLGQVVADTDWGQRSRWMYERRVAEPR